MTTNTLFEPHWASPPHITIRRIVAEKGWTVDELSDHLGIGDPATRRLITGEQTINSEVAELLSSVLGGTSRFWLQREEQYQESCNALTADALVQKLPMTQMIQFGWVDTNDSWRQQADLVLNFFGVEEAENCESRVRHSLEEARYRTSASYDSNDFALAAWLRKAELLALERNVDGWNPQRLVDSLSSLRELTKKADPAVFIPRLEEIAATAGLVVVTLRSLEGCRVSGVTFKAANGVPVIALSARHLSDDHYWFTLFHEVGHLVCHGSDNTFIDNFDDSDEDASAVEQEANAYAQQLLLPRGFSGLNINKPGGPTHREVAAFASHIGIAPGLVVGQLQHQGVVARNRLNRLKRRYRWDGLTLRI